MSSKKVKVTWSRSGKKGFSEKNTPTILGEAAYKLEYFDISIEPPGLLTRNSDLYKEEAATVRFHYSYNNPQAWRQEQTLENIRTPIDVIGANRDLFISTKALKDKEIKSVIKQAALQSEALKDIEKTAIKKVEGLSGEVYAYCLDTVGANRDLFISTWNKQKDRKYKSFTGIPFRTAASNEKLLTKVTEAGMRPKKFAEKVGKDYGNFFRELKGQTKLTLKQALEYSKELDCDPVELLFEDLRCDVWGSVDLYNPNDLGNNTFSPGQIIPQAEMKSVIIPRNIYTPNLKAIKINSEGSYLHKHFIFYKKSDTESSTHHGRLVVAGKTDSTWSELGIDNESYWFGIYDVQKGGKQKIFNPDPFSEKNEIEIGPFNWIAPVTATMHPSSLIRDYNYYEMLRKAGKYYRLAEQQRELMENKVRQQEMAMKKITEELDKIYYQDLKKDNKVKEDIYLKEFKRLTNEIKKRA